MNIGPPLQVSFRPARSELFVGNNGVCPTLDTLVDVDKGNVFLDVESLGVLGRKLEDLL
jgi:hypothetical protein